MLKARFGQDFDERIARTLPFLFHRRVHPNALSLVGLCVSLGGAFAFAEGQLRLGAGVVVLGGVFDLVDGVVARRQGRATSFGGFLDSSLDRVVDMALLLGLLMHYARGGDSALAWLTALALVASVMVSYTKARAESVLGDFEGGLLERAERIVILVLGGLFDVMPLALALVALGSLITAGQRIALAQRRMSALDASAARSEQQANGVTTASQARSEPQEGTHAGR